MEDMVIVIHIHIIMDMEDILAKEFKDMDIKKKIVDVDAVDMEIVDNMALVLIE